MARLRTDSPSRISIRKIVLWTGLGLLAVLLILLIISYQLPGEYSMEAQLTVPRPLSQVWDALAQYDSWPHRIPGVSSVQKLSPGPIGPGTRLQVVISLPGNKTLSNSVEVTDWVEEKLYEHRHLEDATNGVSLPVTQSKVRLEFKSVAEDRTQVFFTGTFQVHGPIQRWMGRLVYKPMADKALTEFLTEAGRRLQGIPR
jgi:carbon monoxide dehydrogenase subunit G